MNGKTNFTREERLHRASLRVAHVMRGMWEEKGASHSRLLEPPLIDDELVTIGRSRACGDKLHREHVIPCILIVRECHRLLAAGRDDEEIAAFIREHVKIVHISSDEARRLDRVSELGLKQRMPEGWRFGDDPFARFEAAGVEWDLLPDP